MTKRLYTASNRLFIMWCNKNPMCSAAQYKKMEKCLVQLVPLSLSSLLRRSARLTEVEGPPDPPEPGGLRERDLVIGACCTAGLLSGYRIIHK